MEKRAGIIPGSGNPAISIVGSSQQQIEELQKKYDKAQEEAKSAKEKADAYDDVQDQVERFSKGLQELFSYPEEGQEG